MKKLFLLALMAVVASMALAQVNPQPGYIITNNGNTVNGLIDLRTSKINTRQCTFKADGLTEYTTYYPGDIEGYVYNIGKRYTTKRFEIDGENKLFFAEVIVQGVAELYKIANSNKERLIIINENGESVCFTAENGNENYTQIVSQERISVRNKIRNVLRNSPSISEKLDDNTLFLTENNIVDLVKEYHQSVCTDGSKCFTFIREKNADRVPIRPMVSIGHMWRTADWEYMDASGFSISAGAEFAMPRVNKNLFAEADLRYSRLNCTAKDYSFCDNLLTLECGVIYKFPIANKLHWYIHPGINIDLGGWESNYEYGRNHGNYHSTKGTFDELSYFDKLYLSTGLGMKIDKHEFIIDLRYRGDHTKNLGDAKLMISVGMLL